jgi:hypothetical protein
MSLRIIAATFFVALLPIALPARELTVYPIDANTIAEYQKLGATYGGFAVNELGYIIFTAGYRAAAKELPGFSVRLIYRHPYKQLIAKGPG